MRDSSITMSAKKPCKSNCNRCKNTIDEMLNKIYGRILRKPRTPAVSVLIEDYVDHACYKDLKRIHDKLVKLSGGPLIGKNKKTLHQSDFSLSALGVLIETDEDQHFTYPRLVSLKNYPKGMRLGYDKNHYMERCKKLDRHDNDPPNRDAQRAWYDTLRDFIHKIDHEYKQPAIRIITGDYAWCSLDPGKPADVKTFKQMAIPKVRSAK